jgi:TctA family transporter
MDLVDNITLGFQTAFTLANLFYCLIGVFLGTLIGVLPGLGPGGYLLRFPVRRFDNFDTG